MASLVQGALVELTGLPGPAKPVPEAQGVAETDLNGQKAQLVSFDRNVKKWTASTFSGDMIAVDEKYVRSLKGEELGGYDYVFGPKSDFDTVGYELADTLASKGYAVMKLFVSPEEAEECVAAAKKLEDDDQFSRLAVEFERGYLGKEGSAKTLLLDSSSVDVPAYVTASPLKMMDHNFGAISQMLGPYTQEALGFDIYSRTNMLLRMPLAEGDEDKYPPADIDDGDAEGYLHTMARKRLSLLQFVGPAGGTLRLFPTAEGGQEVKIAAEPGTVVLIVSSRYEYTLESEGESLALTCFYMAAPAVYQIFGAVKGDTEVLGLLGSGPPPPPGEQVTVNSMYCRYGTGANGKWQFWNGVGKAATDGLTDIPFVRWDHSPYFDPDQTWGGAYTRHGCFGIEGVDLFDCKFFEISPAEAKGMDPCQRQVMEVSYMALLEGGWDRKSLSREPQNIGHFVGIDKDDWMCMSASGFLNLSGGFGATASALSIMANRFSYSLNLKGVSMNIDTACSSSLVAVNVSKQHLKCTESEKMTASIVNGINLMLFHGPFVSLCAAGMLSHEGRSLTFNDTADGYARSECCGAACFRVQPFDKHGTSIACLAGSEANQDGRGTSVTSPNGPAQEKCLNAVLRECALAATEVDGFECNGVGTYLGDPIEVSALRKVMNASSRADPLCIASAKSNVGHGEGGSGFCGFVKSVLQVSCCEAAAGIHLRFLNPHVDLEGFPCRLLTETITMLEDSAYSGVSSFGFAGTNAHTQAWGRNIMTTRGGRHNDPTAVFQKRLAAAPPAEITMNGDDVQQWETTGLDPRADRSSRWTILIDDDGVAEWELDDLPPEHGDKFYIRGTFSDWMPEELERHDEFSGLWSGTIMLGAGGQEHFQVIADNDLEKVFHPAERGCTQKCSPVQGPERAGQDLSWVIQGEPGETFTVEFFRAGRHLSVIWMRQR
mmetsp:Transcript_71275/g.208941  ORF Transcript_71275/g.208941 Transcript_71275/m.208941 type:complete len:943 (-) Transcript_71275:79-2907(-)